MAKTPKPLIDPNAPTPEPLAEVNNPPYVPPMGHADAPPPVPDDPNRDQHTQDYLDGFAKSPDPRDPVESELTPGELNPPTTNEGDGGTPATAPPVNIDVPVVSQDAAVLNCTMGNWDGVPTAYAYQWQCAGLEVGTGESTYPLIVDDVGQAYSCVVTATNAAGPTEAPASNEVTVAGWTV